MQLTNLLLSQEQISQPLPIKSSILPPVKKWLIAHDRTQQQPFLMSRRKYLIRYILFDYLSALLAWTLFYSYRKLVTEPQLFGKAVTLEFTNHFYLGILLIPLFWVTLYTLWGFYNNPLRKSRLLNLWQTLSSSFVGVIIIFFVLILDDLVANYSQYYTHILILFTLHFGLTQTLRYITTAGIISKQQKKELGFPTLIIGSNEKALSLLQRIESSRRRTGNIITGFIVLPNMPEVDLTESIPCLGSLQDLGEITDQHQVEEVIIACEASDHRTIGKVINSLEYRTITIKAIPNVYDILTGTVKMSTIYSAPLVKISNGLMPAWQLNLKRILDITFSILLLLLTMPLMAIMMLLIKTTSKGKIFYKQERIGRFGEPFLIYKFRSMHHNAERNGPMLTEDNDTRITPLGRYMRRTHIDELPQLINVIKGDMSLVGPRPERQFYIDKIIDKAPYYRQLHRIRPGITSWGQVKYGYAHSVEQMIERLSYDLIYLKNMSLYLDFKILIYTALNVIGGQGK